MAQSVSPTDLGTAVERQLDLWNESRELIDREGEAAYTRTGSPVIVTDEVVGSHEFDEAKAESERRFDAERSERVQKVAAINQIAGKVLSGEPFDDYEEVWRDLVEQGSGVYRGLRPTMERQGVYIYGCPHLLLFENGRPIRAIRLRGTEYVERPEPYSNQLVGPWLTCRILERGRFDVSDLLFTLVRYDRREHPDVERVKMLSQIQHAYATDGTIQNIDITDAVAGFSDVRVDTYEYKPRFKHNGTVFNRRLARSIEVVRGEREPSERE